MSRGSSLHTSFSLLLCVGCLGITVDAVHDPDADFAAIRSYAWFDPPFDAPTSIRDATLFEAIAAQLEAKGLVFRSEAPDVLVAVHRTVEDTLHTQSWGYEFAGGRTSHDRLQEGALVIDLVSAATLRSIWRGTAADTLQTETTFAGRRELLASLLRDMFDNFPPRR